MTREEAREILQNLNSFMAETVTNAEYEADIQTLMKLIEANRTLPEDAKPQ